MAALDDFLRGQQEKKFQTLQSESEIKSKSKSESDCEKMMMTMMMTTMTSVTGRKSDRLNRIPHSHFSSLSSPIFCLSTKPQTKTETRSSSPFSFPFPFSSIPASTKLLLISLFSALSTLLSLVPLASSLSLSLSLPKCHSSQLTVLLIYTLFISMAFCVNPVGANIDCFKCVSRNGNNPSCEDPFHHNYSSSILESPCMGGRKGRNGVFPATACIKLAGRYDDTGERIIVRGCALDSGTLTTDTEIIRMSHCGSFYFDDRYVKGCLQSCSDSDACNGTSRLQFQFTFHLVLVTFILLFRGALSSSIELLQFSQQSS